MSPEERQNLVILYKVSQLEKSKALLEQQLWAGTTKEERAEERRIWLQKLLGTTQSAAGYRAAILALGDDGDAIWERVDSKKMATSAGAELAVEARKMVSDRKFFSLRAAVEEALKEYDARPVTVWINGVQVRRRNPVSKPSMLESQPPVVTSPPPPEADGKPFWETLRLLVVPFVATRLQGADPVVAEMMSLEFERDLKILMEDFQLRIHRAARTAKSHSKVALRSVSRTKLRAACDALDMAAPEFGKPVNIAEALSKKWKLARAYHPDSNGGLETESTREKLKAALEAYKCLEEYNASLSNGVNHA